MRARAARDWTLPTRALRMVLDDLPAPETERDARALARALTDEFAAATGVSWALDRCDRREGTTSLLLVPTASGWDFSGLQMLLGEAEWPLVLVMGLTGFGVGERRVRPWGYGLPDGFNTKRAGAVGTVVRTWWGRYS